MVLWLAFIGWAACIYYFSSLSGRRIEELNFLHLWDKAAHFAAFAAGGALLAASFRVTTAWRRSAIFRRTILILALFAASDEYHQLYTAGRSGADVRDWLADLVGVTCGTALVCWCLKPAIRTDS